MGELIEEAKRVLRMEAEALMGLIPALDGGFEDAVGMIDSCRGRVIITGMGKSGLIGKKICATFSSIGVPSSFLHPAEAIHGDLGMVTGSDVVIAISNSGETDEIVSLIPHLKRFDVRLVVLSGNPGSTLGRAADAHISVAVGQEACPFGVVPTCSSTAALAMGDALAVALIKKRGFRAEDFAFLHPGGSLGKKLLVRVGDLMHAGDGLPLVSPSLPMINAVMEISSKRLGITLVAGEGGMVVGVITDGDLRRGIERHGRDFFEKRAEEVMTRNPRAIAAEELAAKALAVMEAHSITALPVTDAGGRAVGVIHIHDILKKGIA
jgi:arabinose-5-phosphate isomerase